MTDLELAEEIETLVKDRPIWADVGLEPAQWQQIIAALRRGPLEEWSQQVRLIVRGIDAQAERITKREQTTWRNGENQSPDEDRDFEDVVIGYKLNTGLWHRLLGLLASCPANERPLSGEMVFHVDGKEMKLCDCPPREGKCPRGVERRLLTTEFSRCLLSR